KELLARPAEKIPEAADVSPMAIYAPEMKGEASAAVPAPAPNAEAVAKLDEYFDQLDSAFARFTNKGPGANPADLAPAVAEDTTPAELDWFGPRGVEPGAFDTSLSLTGAPTLPSGL